MTALEIRIKTNLPMLNESQRRLYLASEAIALGKGGIKEVSKISGVHRNTISAGIKELNDPNRKIPEHVSNGTRIRREGGGRKPLTETHPELLETLNRLVDPESYGNPLSVLRHTTKGLRQIAEELRDKGFPIHHDKLSDLLKQIGFSLRQTGKPKRAGKDFPDRDGQFRHINGTARKYLDAGLPVISVECKKIGSMGNIKDGGAEHAPEGGPEALPGREFPLTEGDAAPLGLRGVSTNEDRCGVGTSPETAAFAVNSIRIWWHTMGSQRYANPKRMYITADGGGSDGISCRLWKMQLQALANELGFPVEFSLFPPGTSKWNNIEHRMLSQAAKDWMGQASAKSLEVIVSLIAAAATETGLEIGREPDFPGYETGIEAGEEELADLKIARDEFCGSWNYTIFPQS